MLLNSSTISTNSLLVKLLIHVRNRYRQNLVVILVESGAEGAWKGRGEEARRGSRQFGAERSRRGRDFLVARCGSRSWVWLLGPYKASFSYKAFLTLLDLFGRYYLFTQPGPLSLAALIHWVPLRP